MLKNKFMFSKRFLFIVFIIIGLIYLCPTKAYASNDIEMKKDNNYSSYEFRPIINKFSFKLDEIIQLSFVVEADSQIKNVSSICDGFVETKLPYVDKEQIEISIILNSKLDKVKYTLVVELCNGAKLESSIYGIIENDKLYINCNSFNAAKDIYWSEVLNDNKKIDAEKIKNEYEAYMNQINAGAVKESSYIIKGEKTNSTKSGVDTYVSGLIRWFDDWGRAHPLQNALLEIMDEGAWGNGSADQLIGVTYTNEYGEYNYGFINRSGGRNIYIKIYPAGENFIVKTGTGNNYVLRTETTYGVITGSTVVRNQDIVDGYEITRAFQISQAVNVSARFAKEMSGETMPYVTVKYPHNETSTNCFYRNNVIYIIGDRWNDAIFNGIILRSYASWDVIQHEYNHHVQHYFNITNSPGGWHTGVNMYDHYMSHHNGNSNDECVVNGSITCANPSVSDAKKYAIRIAYAEAWPSIVGAISQQYAISNFNLDNNIATVGDAEYRAYNGVLTNYEDEVGGGEANENAICGFLWDLYDSNNETHDEIFLGTLDLWNLTINSEAKTLSELVNYYVNNYLTTYDLPKIGRLSSAYQLSSPQLTIFPNGSNAPSFSWIADGPSTNLRNNDFYIIFYDCYYNEIMRIHTTNRPVTLSQEQWDSIIYSYGNNYYVTVVTYETHTPITGGYYSNFISFAKPIEDIIDQNISIPANSRYYEHVVKLASGQMIDYNVTFEQSGNKVIQTFGSRDTYLYLYSQNEELLTTNDDAGYGTNALINYTVQADETYIVRLKFYNQNEVGEIKIGIIIVIN